MPSRVTRRQAIAALGALSLPVDRVFAQSAARAGTDADGASAAPAAKKSDARNAFPASALRTDLAPDLGNFHPMLEWLARENAPRLSFLDPKWTALDPWKAAARPVLHDRLGYSPKPLPLKADFVRREERDGFTLETINVSATPAYHIPTRVLIPTSSTRRREGKLPAVLALHCHSGKFVWGHEKVVSSPDDSAPLVQFRNGAYGRPWAEALCRRGFIVIAADAFYFGSRRLRAADLAANRVANEAREAHATELRAKPHSAEWIAAANRLGRDYQETTAKALISLGASFPGLHVWDGMRTVDYLVSRPEVDPARIGCAGLSIGGIRTAMTIAADARIKAACVTGWMTEFAHQLKNHANGSWMAYTPGLYRALDLPDAAALHAPGALLVQQCSRDLLFPMSGLEGSVDKLTRIYAKAGIPERFRGSFHNVPHSFREPMQEEAFAWFERWL